MRIYLGSDHRGFKLKEELKIWLVEYGHDVIDLGASSLIPDDDYVDYAVSVAKNVAESLNKVLGTRNQAPTRGVVICGSGVGVDIVANRFKGIRCGLGISPDQILAARNDDDINVLALASDYIDAETAKEMVKTFLETEFSGEERYRRRIQKLKGTEI